LAKSGDPESLVSFKKKNWGESFDTTWNFNSFYPFGGDFQKENLATNKMGFSKKRN